MSDNEKYKHLRDSLDKGVRYDGRKKDQFRKLEIKTGVVATAEGSAQVTCGNTQVIAGVKMAVEKPFPDTPDQGILMVGAELLPLSNPKYEAGPPDGIAIEVARVIDRGIRESKALDNQRLCIKAGENVWTINVDICPLNDDGNLIDVGSVAAVAAVLNARFPEFVDGKVDYKKKTTEKVPLSKIPVAVTVVKIGNNFIVDPTETEEKALDARLTITTLNDKEMCSLQKGGEETLTIEEIDKMLDLALEKGEELRKIIRDAN